jgi:hypothetical protein
MSGVIDLLLVLIGSASFGQKARQGFDDEPLLLVVELLPQARLRNGNLAEVQIQLRHGPPGLLQILLADRGRGAAERR